MIKGLNKYWILNIVKSIAVVFIYTSCQFLKTYMYAAVLFIWLLQRVNFEFRFKILMSSLEIQQSLSFFSCTRLQFPPLSSFPLLMDCVFLSFVDICSHYTVHSSKNIKWFFSLSCLRFLLPCICKSECLSTN